MRSLRRPIALSDRRARCSGRRPLPRVPFGGSARLCRSVAKAPTREFAQPLADLVRVALHEIAVRAVDDQLRRESDACRDDGQSGRERFEHHEGIRLVGARQDEQVGRTQYRRRVGCAPAKTTRSSESALPGERLRRTDRLRSTADDQEVSLPVRCGVRRSRAVGPCDRTRGPRRRATIAFAGRAEGCSLRGALGGRRRSKPLEVDAVRDDRDGRGDLSVRRSQQFRFGCASGPRSRGGWASGSRTLSRTTVKRCTGLRSMRHP